MAEQEPRDEKVVPLPGQESDAERQRIRESNDRDQRAERRGQTTPHNAGYDEAVDGTSRKPVNAVDEE
jgi:hypothetical protein